MKFDYYDMLSGKPIYVSGVGHLHSPSLHSVNPSEGVGYGCYNLYLNILSWEKESLLKYASLLGVRGAEKLAREEIKYYDAITLLPKLRDLAIEVLSFFTPNYIKWDERTRSFFLFQDGTSNSQLGLIDKNNFDEIRSMMLQLNYIGLTEDSSPVKGASPKAKEMWEKAQKFLKEQSNKKSDNPELKLSNIISKLCAAHQSYNLLNIYDLTVFQLYDQFFQYGYIRGSNLNEQIFSNHGGEKFNFQDWLKPIIKM